jgi:hypothetical protein
MGLFRRKQRDTKSRDRYSDRNKDTRDIRSGDSREREVIGKRFDGVMEPWTNVPIGKQKSDGSGERN